MRVLQARASSAEARLSFAGLTRGWPRPGDYDGTVQRDPAVIHEQAAVVHDEAAARHLEAAELWERRGEMEHAALERRNAELERTAAQLERDRGATIRLGPGSPNKS